MPKLLEKRGRKARGELTIQEMLFGKYLFTEKGNACSAYRKAFPKQCAKISEDTLAWRAYKLKKFLRESGWFLEQLDNAGVTDEKISQVINDLLNAEEIKFFQKDGIVITERTVADHKSRAAGARLAMEAKKLLVQKTELQANVSVMPTTWEGWLKQDLLQETIEVASDE
jgi:hypothetical protein